MSTPILPKEHSGKIEQLRAYFQARKPSLVVRAGWHPDTRTATFPFDDGPCLRYLLRVSKVVLQDYEAEEIVRMLESAKWEDVLENTPPDQMAVFTSTGFLLELRLS